MSFSKFLTCLICLLTLTAAAEEKTLLLLPFEVGGNYRPISAAELTEKLRAELEKSERPKLQVKVHGQPVYYPTPEQVAQIGRQEGADYVLYGDIRFSKDIKAANLTGMQHEGYPGGSGVRHGFDSRYMVVVGAVGHGKVVDAASGALIAERPELLMESEYTGAVKGGSRMEEVEDRLAKSCLNQFTRHLLEKLKDDTIKTGKAGKAPVR